MEPWKLLPASQSAASCVRLPTLTGMEPVNRLESRKRRVSCVRAPRLAGMEPPSALLLSCLRMPSRARQHSSKRLEARSGADAHPRELR